MKRPFSRFFISFSLFSLCLSPPCLAGEPTDRIKTTTEKIIAIVSNPAMQTPEKAAERKELIRKAVDECFDWEEMSRRSLGRHWTQRTEEEKKEFVNVFGKLLERTYLERVEGYSGEKVVYEDESVDGDYAAVKVKILTKQGAEIPVEYRLRNKGCWNVYDISIEGVSLVHNYRNQFNSIITRSSYQELMKKVKAKVEGS